ncbi:MAG: AAA family ATPase, partial [Candidatus Udaeobacter sp.]
MKIYNLELESVRNIRHLRLDLSAPCTVITGRTGTCKSTVQLATLVSLFRTSKKERDSLISRFDPDVKPKAILELSRNENGPTIKLSRSLLDDGGEWREGGSTTRAKGKALDKVQEVLPISANAAACLLWGQQECLCDVLKEFPADGHSALTAATVRGAGPDPKRVIDELDKSYKASKRAGNSPGAWTRMSERVSQLEAELTASQQAEQELNQLREQYAASSSVHRQLSGERLSCKSTLQQLREQQKCLKAVLGVNKDLASARKSQAEWNQLDSRAAKQTATCTTLEDELNVLQSQYRVARDKELASEIAQLDSHVKLVTMARTKVLGAEVQISAKSRPDRKSLDRLRELSTELRDANTRMEANGLRYRVTVEHGQFNVEIAEDTESAITKVVTRESPHESIVGSVV